MISRCNRAQFLLAITLVNVMTGSPSLPGKCVYHITYSHHNRAVTLSDRERWTACALGEGINANFQAPPCRNGSTTILCGVYRAGQCRIRLLYRDVERRKIKEMEYEGCKNRLFAPTFRVISSCPNSNIPQVNCEITENT